MLDRVVLVQFFGVIVYLHIFQIYFVSCPSLFLEPKTKKTPLSKFADHGASAQCKCPSLHDVISLHTDLPYKFFLICPLFHLSIGGSVVEFSPATRETGVRFPANARFFLF